ncbi:MAG TPA: LysM peptidoglycan-binding domain-containing protein [Anaerolineales bacterium]|nr:LysM peptidoglycan-binding domain-containing protein [Anaerolineales bacterium]
MNKIIRKSLVSILVLVLSACNLFGSPNQGVFENSVLRLTVQTQNNVTTFGQAGEIVNFQYVITNTGTPPLAGPVLVTDAPRQIACPGLNTVGNQDNYLDQNESITCLAAYTVTQSDVTTGSIVSNATATAGNVTSNQATLTLNRGTAPQPSNVLTLSKTASSQTYGAADQTITYSFTITNTGPTSLGPAQFMITDSRMGAPFPCGPADTTLASNQSVTCSRDYRTTSADMSLANITNSASASGAGQTSAAANAVVTNLLAPATQTPPTPATAPPSSNLAPGSTVQHRVAVGEWLIQIVRCYGATFDEVRNANPQIADPDFILPAMTVTVPRIGSSGRIYGPPCITFHTVQSGDTWASLAQRYNADLAVLQKANPGGLVVGQQAKIPLNSAGGGGVVVTPGATAGPTATGNAPTAQRITFEPGSTTASRIGVINPNERIQYVVNAPQGQLMTISLTAPPNEVSLGVNNPNGLAIKTPDALYTWSATVTAAGDHTINLASLTGNTSKSYTLTVSLTNPTTPTTPQATLIVTPETPINSAGGNPGDGP